MPYTALDNGKVKYIGNNINKSKIIDYSKVEYNLLENRVERIKKEESFIHIANIDNAIFQSTVGYFSKIGAKWTNLPLTTLMSSTGKTGHYSLHKKSAIVSSC